MPSPQLIRVRRHQSHVKTFGTIAPLCRVGYNADIAALEQEFGRSLTKLPDWARNEAQGRELEPRSTFNGLPFDSAMNLSTLSGQGLGLGRLTLNDSTTPLK